MRGETMTTLLDYGVFLKSKTQCGAESGFEPIEIPDFLFPHQRYLAEWSIRRGRSAIFADCGMGKTPILLTWADNVVRYSGKPVLVLTPLAVSGQMLREAGKFGFDAEVSRDGRHGGEIVITNYERLRHFDPGRFAGVVCDESSILKNFNGKTRAAVTEFMRTIPYRLLCTATAAPNDYVELGTSAEAIGEMGYQDMITRFFRQETSKDHLGWGRTKYRMKPHAERDFWRWICSWARACRSPSDLGFDDGQFVLPGLVTREHTVVARTRRPGTLFEMAAETLQEQREERRRTLIERCEKVAELTSHGLSAVAWCHLNDEADLCERLISGAIQVSGSDSDEAKEEAFLAFESGEARVMVTKPEIAGFGLNWQHCWRQTFFPSHSFEQFYQAMRRSLRFGQRHTVEVDIVTSEGEAGVLANLNRKAAAAEEMFSRLVDLMNDQMSIDRNNPYREQEEIPGWL